MNRLRRVTGLLVIAGVMSLLLCACLMTAPGTENGTPEQIAALTGMSEATGTPIATEGPTDAPTDVPASTDTPTPVDTMTPTMTPEPTATETPAPEPTATNTPTPEPTPTNTPTPKPTNTPTPEPTATNTPTPKPTKTPTPKPTKTPTPEPTATNTPTPKPTKTPTPVPSDTPTPKAPTPSEVTPKPSEAVKTPTPTGSKTPTASGEKIPTPPTKTSSDYPNVEGRRGVLNETEYLRPGAGRVYAREIKLTTSSKIVVVETIKSEFNEIWYKAATLIDGKVVYGYLQAAAVDLDTETPKTYKNSSLTKVGIGDLTMKHGKDRDEDGVYVVVLDPGHGKQFSGAYHSGTSEHTMTLKVAKYCKEYLESTYENVKVYLTRTDENCLDMNSDIDDLERRVRYAKKKGADILVSLHFDAFSGSVRGAEGLIPHEKKYEKCKALASQILDKLDDLGIQNLGCMTRISERSRYSYPDGAKMDAYLINRLGIESGIVTCIIEHAHMDNKKDFDEFCSTDSKLKKLGIADAEGIASYLGLKKKGTSGTPTPTTKPEATPTTKPEATPTTKPTEEVKGSPSPEPTEDPKTTPAEEPNEEPEVSPAEKPAEEPNEEPEISPAEEPEEEPETTQVEEPDSTDKPSDQEST